MVYTVCLYCVYTEYNISMHTHRHAEKKRHQNTLFVIICLKCELTQHSFLTLMGNNRSPVSKVSYHSQHFSLCLSPFFTANEPRSCEGGPSTTLSSFVVSLSLLVFTSLFSGLRKACYCQLRLNERETK